MLVALNCSHVCGCKSTLRAKHQTQNIWVFDQQCWIRYRPDDQKNRPARHDFLFRFLKSPPEWGLRIEWVVVRNFNLVHRSLFDTLLKGTFFEMVVFWSYDTSLLCGENFDINGAFFRHRLLHTFHYSFHNAEMKRSANIISWFLEHAVRKALIISCELCCLMWLHSLLLCYLGSIPECLTLYTFEKLLKCSKIERASIWNRSTESTCSILPPPAWPFSFDLLLLDLNQSEVYSNIFVLFVVKHD